MADVFTSKMTDKEILKGLWWLPEQENIQCYGTLSLGCNGEQELCILGYLEGACPKKLSHYSVIHGKCMRDRKPVCVTLFDASVTYLPENYTSGPSVSETRIMFSNAWIGNAWYDSKTDVLFSSFCLGMMNLENWLDERNVFSSTFDQDLRKFTATMDVPDPIPLFSDDLVEISIDYSRQGGGYELGQKETSLQCCPEICIVAKDGTLPYYGKKDSFSSYCTWLIKFFELLMAGRTYPHFLCGYGPVGEDRYPKYTTEFWFSMDVTPLQEKKISPLEVLIPCRVVKDNLCSIVRQFESRYDELFFALETLSESLKVSNSSTLSFANLLFAMEGMQKAFYPDLSAGDSVQNKASFDEFKQNRDQILARCETAELQKFVREKLQWQVGFRTRICGMLQDMNATFPFLTDDVCKKLSGDLRDIRVMVAHSIAENHKSINLQLLLRQAVFVKYLQIAIIMKHCGVPESVLNECFYQQRPAFIPHIDQFFSDYYSPSEVPKNG